MIKSIHLSKKELKIRRGDITLPHADAKEFGEDTKTQLNELIAKILTESQENGDGEANA